jgi:cytochrome c oxidase subunit 2
MKKITKTSFWAALTALPLTAASFLTATAAYAQEDSVIGMAKPWEIGFQTPASPMSERMEWFHNKLLLPTITAITLLVLALLLYVILRFNRRANPVPSKTTHNMMLEVLWTLVPVLILVVIVIPSMRILYYVDRTHEAEMTLKVTGFQWYWGYEYSDYVLSAKPDEHINFLANIVPDKELKEGQQRLLSTDNVVILPVDTNIRLLITASDVIHAWAVPSFGVKLDAVPGRTNETWVRIDREGIFYGQCSELCGTNHGFMPIEVHAVSKEKFAEWVKSQGGMPEPAGDTSTNTSTQVEKAADAPQKAAAEMAPEDVKAQEDVKRPAGKINEKTKDVIDAIPPVEAVDKKEE